MVAETTRCRQGGIIEVISYEGVIKSTLLLGQGITYSKPAIFQLELNPSICITNFMSP